MPYLLKYSFLPSPLPGLKVQDGGYVTDIGFLLFIEHCSSKCVYLYLCITDPQNKIRVCCLTSCTFSFLSGLRFLGSVPVSTKIRVSPQKAHLLPCPPNELILWGKRSYRIVVAEIYLKIPLKSPVPISFTGLLHKHHKPYLAQIVC